MVKRRSPIRHKVRSHTRQGKPINPFWRGTGKKQTRKKVVGSKIKRIMNASTKRTSNSILTLYGISVPLKGRYDQPISIVPPPLPDGYSWEEEVNGIRFKYIVVDDGTRVKMVSPLGPTYFLIENYLDNDQKRQLNLYYITKDMKFWQDRWLDGQTSVDHGKHRIVEGRQKIRSLGYEE